MSRTFLKTTLVLALTGIATPIQADPLDLTDQPDLTAARVVLASLHRELVPPVLLKMSPRISGPEVVLGTREDKGPLIRIAGRCGSSDYYCDSPGFTYCCGNATDGFYCAADVNGC
jgi:hypothetical protein